jgi:hypothetical protein
MENELVVQVAEALSKVAEQSKSNDEALLDLVKALIGKVNFLEHRVEELELLTRIVTTKPQ